MATEARIDPTGIGHANSGRNGQTEKARLSGKLKCEVPKSAASSPRWRGESRGGQRLGSGHIWGEGEWAAGRAGDSWAPRSLPLGPGESRMSGTGTRRFLGRGRFSPVGGGRTGKAGDWATRPYSGARAGGRGATRRLGEFSILAGITLHPLHCGAAVGRTRKMEKNSPESPGYRDTGGT